MPSRGGGHCQTEDTASRSGWGTHPEWGTLPGLGGTKGPQKSCSSKDRPPQLPLCPPIPAPPPRSLPHTGDISQLPPRWGPRWGGGGDAITREPPEPAEPRAGTPCPGYPQPKGVGGAVGVPTHPPPLHHLQNPAIFPRNPARPLQPAEWRRRDRVPCPPPRPRPHPCPHPHPRPRPRPHPRDRGQPPVGYHVPGRGQRPRPAVAATQPCSAIVPCPSPPWSLPLVVGGEDATAGGVVAVFGLSQAGGAPLFLPVGRAGRHGGGRCGRDAGGWDAGTDVSVMRGREPP